MSIIPQLSWAFCYVCDFVCNQLAAIARLQKILQAYYTSLLRLLYGCRMCTFLKKKSLGFVKLPQDLRTKSWSRLATISSQTSFLTCLLLGLKTAARQTHDDFSCWQPWWTCQLINTVMRGPYGSCTIIIIIFIFLKAPPPLCIQVSVAW